MSADNFKSNKSACSRVAKKRTASSNELEFATIQAKRASAFDTMMQNQRFFDSNPEQVLAMVCCLAHLNRVTD